MVSGKDFPLNQSIDGLDGEFRWGLMEPMKIGK